MEREHSTACEADKSAKKRPLTLSGAAACNTKFGSKWCSRYPVKASSSQPYFLCVGIFSEM